MIWNFKHTDTEPRSPPSLAVRPSVRLFLDASDGWSCCDGIVRGPFSAVPLPFARLVLFVAAYLSMPTKRAASKAGHGAETSKKKKLTSAADAVDAGSWTRPDFIDEDLWPDQKKFSKKSNVRNLEILKSVILQQIHKVELELFQEDYENEQAGKLTEVTSPSKNKPVEDSVSVSLAAAKTPSATDGNAGNTADENKNANVPPLAISEASKEEDGEKKKDEYDGWTPPPQSIPICTDVRLLETNKLRQMMIDTRNQLFDVIMMDPPWQLATANPTRGVAIGYQQLADFHIKELPVKQLQTDGFIFVWVINAKYRFALSLLEHWGYELVDEIVWVKQTVNRRLAKSHGFYLQHAKETCLVGRKGKHPSTMVAGVKSDVIFSERRGQSQKPEEIYEYIQHLVPNGHYLEIFARRNNLHDYWVSVGNEL